MEALQSAQVSSGSINLLLVRLDADARRAGADSALALFTRQRPRMIFEAFGNALGNIR